MSKIDASLNLNLRLKAGNQLPADLLDRYGFSADGQRVSVLVQFNGETGPLVTAGLQIASRTDDVMTGDIAVSAIDALAALEGVVRIEGARLMHPMLDIATADAHLGNTRSPGIGTPPTAYRGRNVIVGLIDSGIDYTHASFRRADGSTRILRIWDQFLVPAAGEAAPAGYSYGVEYTDTQINSALGNASPHSVVRHRDRGAHGTHVAGIAAGNGRAAGTFAGVAPEADIIMVRNDSRGSDGTLQLANSVRTVDALHYIYSVAAALNRPVVVNQSQSMNVGPHDGTTLLEQAINRELGFPGRAYVCSSGNQADNAIAVSGSVPASGNLVLTFSVPAGDVVDDTIDLWYPGNQRLSVTLTNPAGVATPLVAPPAAAAAPTTLVHTLAGGNVVAIDSRIDSVQNHDNEILIRLTRGTAASIASGTWRITLTNAGTTAVPFDAWIERPVDGNPVWTGSPDTVSKSVAIPASAREAIAVGCYRTKTGAGADAGGNKGTLSDFSSRGPTRDGRIKPDLSAPGEFVMSAMSIDESSPGTTDASGTYQLMAGTSMSTPMVAGTVALILEKNPTLRQEQIRLGLQATARKDAKTGTGSAVPNNNWGHGKLDIEAAVAYNYPAFASRNWVRIRTMLYNWTEADTPPTFEISANENGEAVIELAWDPQALLAPSTGYVPLRYYNTGQALDVTITKAAGGNQPIQLPVQVIRLAGNRARWQMPQALWDGYREELRKARAGQSTMSPNLYYRVRLNPAGAASVLIWPPDASFQNDPMAQRLAIIQTRLSAASQVAPDQAAVDAMPVPWGAFLQWLWNNLPADSPDRQSLAAVFSHRFFSNEIETATRGKILMLWLFAGPGARQKLPTLLDTRFRNAANLEMSILKQPDLKDHELLVDHLLALLQIDPHPDIAGVTAAEQLVDDALTEIMDPNGQTNQGTASTCGPTSVQTLLINTNASEYVRLLRGLLGREAKATLANGDLIEVPPGVYQVARYAGTASLPFFVRTNAELGFQSAVLRYARGSAWPEYDPSAPPDAPNGVNTVFQETMRRGVTAAQLQRALSGLLGRAHSTQQAPQPTDALRNDFVQRIQQARDPMLLVVHWGAPPSDAAHTGLHAVVALRGESGRVFFKNPQYAGSSPPAGAAPDGGAAAPPRRYEDPAQALESMGDNDLGDWIRWFHHPA